jgi:hypothetical protein
MANTGSWAACGSARTRPATRSAGTRSHTARSPQPDTWCEMPGPPANRRAAAHSPDPAAPESSTATPAVPLPQWPASSGRPAATPGSAAPPHPPPTRPVLADTPVDRPRPTPSSRVLRTPQHPCDHLDRHPFRPMQPTDLSPISTLNTHFLLTSTEVSITEWGQFSTAAKVSFNVPSTLSFRSTS